MMINNLLQNKWMFKLYFIQNNVTHSFVAKTNAEDRQTIPQTPSPFVHISSAISCVQSTIFVSLQCRISISHEIISQ